MAGETRMTLIKINPRSTIESMQSTNKNLLLNGDFSVCQRLEHKGGLVESNIISGSNGVRIDRWNVGGSGGTSGIDGRVYHHTATGDGYGVAGFRNSHRWNVTTGNATLHADNYVYTQQRIETKNVVNRLYYGTSNAKTITLSFWVRSNVTGKYGVSLVNRKNVTNPGHRRRNIMSYTINASNTWEKKSVTFVGDTDTNFQFDQSDDNQQPYFAVAWHWAAGTNRIASASSDYTSEGVWYTDTLSNGIEYVAPIGQVNAFATTNNDIYLAGCQLEIGTVATDFEHKSFQTQIDECQRYLFVGTHGNEMSDNNNKGRYYGLRYSTSSSMARMGYPTVMASLPTLTYTAAGGATSTDYSRTDGFQLYDSDDVTWRVHSLIADAELG